METPDIRTKLGRFSFIEEYLFATFSRPAVAAIMKDVIVVETNRSAKLATVEFFACSEQFDVLEQGECVPEYIAQITTVRTGDEDDSSADEISVSWRRV